MWQIMHVKICTYVKKKSRMVLKVMTEIQLPIMLTFKVLVQHEAVWMTVISPFKNHMPLLPDIQYLPKGNRVHSDYTSF